MELIFSKKMNPKLKGESFLRLKLQEVLMPFNMPKTSMFYLEPSIPVIVQNVERIIKETNDTPRNGYNNASSFMSELTRDGKRLLVFKIMAKKQPELLAEFKF